MPSITRRRAQEPGRPASAEADILAATRRLLAGSATFTELGVQQISAEAGVARSTFYVHFRDKTDLLMRLATTMTATSFDIASAWEPADGVRGLADAFLRVLGVYREHAAVLRAVTEVSTYDEAVRTLWSERLAQFTDRTVAVLLDEQDADRTPASVDRTAAARIIVIGGERAIFDHITTADPGTDEVFARELALTWWYGVYRRPADDNG
ncbi:MAG TPA: helix-turn-helix domain-containing protein [Trebonia sp.]|nr:helix-turn-helix domain-containing protein [Trebonia sp.]